MAVIQISKIQHRRGLKNNNVGIPQLSAAELAWAVDTQELYIGNGSVSEGAPYVGNTKILTEHDNIIELASSYRFASTDPTITLSVPRSLSSKLDEQVSILDFGAVPDGSTDCSDAFETAFSQLFRNADNKYKKTLILPNGTYLFNRSIKIPSNTRMQGETQSGVILDFYANDISLITELGTEVTGPFTDVDRPTDIYISNLTIAATVGQFVITGLKDSVFDQVTFVAGYQLGDPVAVVEDVESAVYWENTLENTKVNNIVFEKCKFINHRLGLHCRQTAPSEVLQTQIKIRQCEFLENHTSILITGVENQINKWTISQSKFEEISASVLYSNQGTGTVVRDCEFVNCGTSTNNATAPTSSFITFVQAKNNVVIDCVSDRQQATGLTLVSTTAAFSEVENANFCNFLNGVTFPIGKSDSFFDLAVFSSANKFTEISYLLNLNGHSRRGLLSFTIDTDQSTVALTDSFQYSSGGAIMTDFEFNATLKNNRGDSTQETVMISYKNLTVNDAAGDISFFVGYGV
jgi:hypothetical protein